MSLWTALLLASAQPETPECEFEAPPPNMVAIQRARPRLCFSYVYPVLAAPLPAVLDWFRADAALREAEALRLLAEAEAEENGGRVPPVHRFRIHWGLSADSRPLLVLDAGIEAYSGGPRENLSTATLYFDRAAGRAIAFWELFSDAAAARRLLDRTFCPALREARAVQFNAPLDDVVCYEIEEHPVVPIADGGRITGLRVVLDPWTTFMEPVDVDLPLTPALLRLVKPRYRAAFAQPQ